MPRKVKSAIVLEERFRPSIPQTPVRKDVPKDEVSRSMPALQLKIKQRLPWSKVAMASKLSSCTFLSFTRLVQLEHVRHKRAMYTCITVPMQVLAQRTTPGRRHGHPPAILISECHVQDPAAILLSCGHAPHSCEEVQRDARAGWHKKRGSNDPIGLHLPTSHNRHDERWRHMKRRKHAARCFAKSERLQGELSA